MTFEPLRTFEAGDTAIDEGWVSGTHSGPMRLPDGHTIDPTGRRVAYVSEGTLRVLDLDSGEDMLLAGEEDPHAPGHGSNGSCPSFASTP